MSDDQKIDVPEIDDDICEGVPEDAEEQDRDPDAVDEEFDDEEDD